jgi:hypothetical protein
MTPWTIPPTIPGRSSRSPYPRRLGLGGLVAISILFAPPAWPQAAQPDRQASHCRFIGGTLVPSLGMGVRRLDDPRIDLLELRRAPDSQAGIVAEGPLFRPYFVAGSATDGAGGRWHLLQEGYTSQQPLGWASERHLHLLESRYAYTFAIRAREQKADLQDLSKESYERLLAQAKGDSDGAREKVVIHERPGAEAWRPVAITDTVPFVELRVPREKRDREHPDTTPTFRFGIPVENRLLHMGAVCGGPIDTERLKDLKSRKPSDNELKMLFVVDETVSMLPFNKVVADFIRSAGRLAEGRPIPVRVAVCSYTDGPPGTRVTPGEFSLVRGPADVRELAERVARLGNDLPPDQFANPPERMLEGLGEALKSTPGLGGGLLFVAVVGDTGHEPTDPDRQKLVAEIAQRIDQTGARVYFMHVGRRREPDEMLFRSDFAAVQREAAALGVPEDRIVYAPAEANNLQNVLESARNEVEDEWRRLQMQIARMESRSPYTEPGPKLLAALEARGLDRAGYDDRHLQYFVPSQGWLFHPSEKIPASARPQFRELFLLAEPERKALTRLFADVRERLSRGEQIDGDALIERFAGELSAAAAHPSLEARVAEAWEKIPAHQRSVGVFLEDVFGLRLKAALPFPPLDYAKEQPATEQEIERLLERIGRLTAAIDAGGEAGFWFEASSLVP